MTEIFDCLKLESRRSQQVHIASLNLHGGVNVAVKSDGRTGVSEYLRKALDFKPYLHTSGGEAVAEGVKMYALKPTRACELLKPPLKLSGFQIILRSGQDKG